MSFAIATFPAAPRDREIGIVPRVVSLAALTMAVVGLVLLAIVPFYGVAFLGLAVADGLVASFLLAIEPVAYVILTDGLTVERRRWRTREFAGSISNARRDETDSAAAVDAFVTSAGNVVRLRVGDAEIAVSPADPDSFVVAAGRSRA